MPRLYQAADIFALASEAEGMSNAELEAKASGLPTATLKEYGLKDEPVDNKANQLRQHVIELVKDMSNLSLISARGDDLRSTRLYKGPFETFCSLLRQSAE
jgi:glycosyltransferase involved in cell wall biosynthesis